MEQKGEGWLTFASIMLVVAGVGNFMWGIGAVVRKVLFENKLLFAHLTFWGIVFMVLGALLAIAGVALISRARWARIFGIIWCSLSIIFYLMVIGAFPVWSVIVIAIDVLIIYALAVYGAPETE
jgi:hypothetical protein